MTNDDITDRQLADVFWWDSVREDQIPGHEGQWVGVLNKQAYFARTEEELSQMVDEPLSYTHRIPLPGEVYFNSI